MKSRKLAVLITTGLLSAAFGAGAFAQQGAQGTGAEQAREKAMKDCFDKHAGLMQKPAVKNPRDCWRTHGYMMDKS